MRTQQNIIKNRVWRHIGDRTNVARQTFWAVNNFFPSVYMQMKYGIHRKVNNGKSQSSRSAVRHSSYLCLGGKLPSPPRQLGDGSITSSFSCITFHCFGVLATMLNAWTGPSNSSAKMALTFRCLCSGVLSSELKASLTITTLKCVSELAGLWWCGT